MDTAKVVDHELNEPYRTLAGDLPSGKAIAEQFGRGERWGRLVKQAGQAALLAPIVTA